MIRPLLVSLTLAAIAPAQTLLADLTAGNPDPTADAEPRQFTEFNGRLYFTAVDTNGRELWSTDGTLPGTRIVTDLRPGSADGLLATAELVVLNGKLVFPARSSAGLSLHSSDGTAAGTRPFGPAALNIIHGPGSMTVHQGVLYFVASDLAHGFELWRTDGTTAGTRMVADINPGTENGIHVYAGTPPRLWPTSSGVYFAGQDAAHGIELWFTDGTRQGTRLVADVWQGALANGDPRHAFELPNGDVLFSASIKSNAFTWWTTDGTQAGTSQVSGWEISSSPDGAFQLPNGDVLFGAFHWTHGRELFRTDGTAAGTQMVLDIYPGNFWSNPGQFVELNGTVYFSARTPVSSNQLWKTDGTANGTAPVTSSVRSISGLRALNGALYFSGYESATGNEPYVSDGTASGTVRLADVLSPHSSHPREFAAFGNRVVFHADTTGAGVEPWITDGTPANTQLLRNIHSTRADSSLIGWTRVGDRAFFQERSTGEIFATDGTPAGTNSVAAGTKLWQFREGRDDTLLLWHERTVLDVERDADRSTFLGTFQDSIFDLLDMDTSYLVSSRAKLFRWDGGTSQGIELRDFSRAFYSVGPFNMFQVGSVAYFMASEGFGQTQGVWRTDGTPGGTQIVLAGGVGGRSGTLQFSDFLLTDRGLWIVRHNTVQSDLWLADESGARWVATIAELPVNWPTHLTAFRDGVVFAGQDGNRGVEPWFSDGTLQGTRILRDVRGGADSSHPAHFAVVDDRLYFSATDGVRGRELWGSDGTAATTQLVLDIVPGAAGSGPVQLTAAGSQLVFAAVQPTTGLELWISDGTAAGTQLQADVLAGPGSSVPVELTSIGAHVVFSAIDTQAGREPFGLSLRSIGSWLSEGFGEGCAGTAGVPTLDTTGAPKLGSAYGLSIESARANASVGVLGAVAFDRVSLPGGCALHLAFPFPIAAGTTDSSGTLQIPMPTPTNTSLVGADIRFQAIVADPQGAMANVLSFTAGRRIVIGS